MTALDIIEIITIVAFGITLLVPAFNATRQVK